MSESRLHDGLTVVDGLQHHGQPAGRESLETLRAGGVTAINQTVAIWERSQEAMNNIIEWHRAIRENSDILRLAVTTDDIETAKDQDQSAVILGFQNTDPLENDLDLVEVFWRLGIRVIQLTYNTQNSVAAGCWESDDLGLSGFVGPSLIRELNQFGILIDVSHSTDQTVLDAVGASEQPIAITHGNPRSFVGTDVGLPRRNRSDDALRAVAESGGLIGLSPYANIAPDGANLTMERWAEMAEYTAELIGVDHVGIGSDLSHLPREYILWCRTGRWSRRSSVPLASGERHWPTWMESAADFPAFTEALLARNWSDDDARKVLGGNFMRVFGDTIDHPVEGPEPVATASSAESRE